VRYFGGVKLGVGGLIRAYKKTAHGTLQNSTISERFLEETLEVVFDYPNWDKVLQIVKQKKMVVLEKKTQLKCHLILSVKKSEFDALKSFLEKQSFLSCI
jgi:putative IMPACT (imprinted ancient) family translation regulator